jgi:DNA-binding LytR/AlgR family response regulator
MNVLVAEDEVLAAEHLISMIRRYDGEIKVVHQIDTVSDAIRILKTSPSLDLIFLDIQLADGKSFEIFEAVKTDLPVIFTTAYDEYALNAFKFHSIDYLLKPIQFKDLAQAIDKFKRLQPKGAIQKETLEHLRTLIQEKTNPFKQRIVIKTGNKLQFKPMEEVAYFFAEGKEAYVVTQPENKKYLISYTLEELEQQLNPDNFFRISRKYIVRADAIAEVKGTVTTSVEIRLKNSNHPVLSVSRDKISIFKKWMDR